MNNKYSIDNVTIKIAYGASWLHVFHQTHNKSSMFRPEIALNYRDDEKFSILGRLEEFRYKGRFEFLLEYKEVPGYNRFSQTSNPTRMDTVENFRPIHLSFETGFYGLALSSNNDCTFIDASPGPAGSWGFAIASYNNYYDGIPGPGSHIVHEVDLWVRIPLYVRNSCGIVKRNSNELLLYLLLIYYS